MEKNTRKITTNVIKSNWNIWFLIIVDNIMAIIN